MNQSSDKTAANSAAQPNGVGPRPSPPNDSGPKPAIAPQEPVKPVAAPPAVKSDDEIKSRPQQEQQQQTSLPSGDAIKGKWKQHVGAARIAWGKLTEDEFLQLEGQQQKLTGLVQERYAITRDEAEKQVKAFFETNKVSA